MKFLDILRRKAPTTAEELAAALAEAEQAARDADARVESLTAERGRLLLDDADDKTIDQVEAALATAARDSDRSGLAVVELKRRLAAATDADRQAVLDAAYAAAMDAQKRGASALRRYGREAPKLSAILAEIDAAEIELAKHRDVLMAAGDARWSEAASADHVVRPRPPGRHLPTIVQEVELPGLTFGVSLWPPVESATRIAVAGPSEHVRRRDFPPNTTAWHGG